MPGRINLDMDVLRTFALGFELGSFTRAADRLGRSQSAVSTQLRKLEEQIGQPLVQKAGRGLALTVAGEHLLSYAKRILEINDEAVDRIRGADVEGWVRLGLPQDFSEAWLPLVLGRFSRAHPKVRIEVQVDRSSPLVEKTVKGELDMALVWGDGTEGPHGQRAADFPIAWIGPRDWRGLSHLEGEPLPLLFFSPPCAFRTAGIAALDDAGIAWRLVFTSPSLSGLWAAAEAGLGITLRTTLSMPSSLMRLAAATSGLPALPSIPLAIHYADEEPSPAVTRLSNILLETIHDGLGRTKLGLPASSPLVLSGEPRVAAAAPAIFR